MNIIGLLTIMAAYMLMMVVIGFFYSKKNTNTSEFYLGGRKLGPLVTAMSAEASDMSSWLLMGMPGLAYVSGCAEAGWTAIGLAIGTYLNWLLVSKRLRNYTAKAKNSITVPSFFANRYREADNKFPSYILLILSTLIIVVFFVPYTAAGFAACGKLFSQLFNADYQLSMIVSAIIIVSYTTMGGFLAASTTDLIQSIIMTLALVIVVWFGIDSVGGIDNVISNANSMAGYLSLSDIHIYDVNDLSKSEPYSGLKIASLMAWGLGYFGMPHILLRFMGTEDPKKLKTSRRIATIWVVIAMSVAIFIGIIGNAMTAHGVVGQFADEADAETLLIKIAFLLSHNGFFLLIMAGLILSGLLACTMSTSDSQLLAASSCISQNILDDCLHIRLSNKSSLLIARISVVIIAISGIFIARDPNSSVFRIISFAWAGFGATFGPTVLLALFWKRSNAYGAIAGMLAGGIVVFVWKFVLASLPVSYPDVEWYSVFSLYELLPAFIAGLVVNVGVSLSTKAPSKEIVKEFESVE